MVEILRYAPNDPQHHFFGLYLLDQMEKVVVEVEKAQAGEEVETGKAVEEVHIGQKVVQVEMGQEVVQVVKELDVQDVEQGEVVVEGDVMHEVLEVHCSIQMKSTGHAWMHVLDGGERELNCLMTLVGGNLYRIWRLGSLL